MSLNLTALRKAIDALECSPAIAKNKKVDLSDDDLLARIRAGIAQNFRTAYEQCWKFTRRWIRENRGADEANYPRTRKELFRMASQNGLISDPLPWFEYGNAPRFYAIYNKIPIFCHKWQNIGIFMEIYKRYLIYC